MPAVFLDRDGVLVRTDVVDGKPIAVKTFAEFELLPGVIEAVTELRANGFFTVVVTNQPDVGKGLIAEDVLSAMHTKLESLLPLNLIMVCKHRQDENCSCRKPQPGMLLQAAAQLDIDLSQSFMIGDRDSDIIAGLRANCYTVLIDRHYPETAITPANERADSLSLAVQSVLRIYANN